MTILIPASRRLRKLELEYEDKERTEDTLIALKEAQIEQQLASLEMASETKRQNEQADKDMERQLTLLERTAPFFAELFELTGL